MRLSGTLSPKLGSLRSLLYFEVQNNRLKGSVPPSMGSMENFQTFVVDGNSAMCGTFSWIGDNLYFSSESTGVNIASCPPQCTSSSNCFAEIEICIQENCVEVIDGCPDGWHPDGAGGCLTRLLTSGVPFATAQTECAASWSSRFPEGTNNEGHLVKIASADVNTAVNSTAEEDEESWIGLSDTAVPGTFRWQDGSVATYFNWGDSEPSQSGACVNIDQGTAEWYTDPCPESRHAVCQINGFCEVDANCPVDTFCVDFRCVQCRNETDCPVDTPFCNFGKCVECVGERCDSGLFCVNNTCVDCKDEYCPTNQVCIGPADGCAECVVDAGTDDARGCTSGASGEQYCYTLQSAIPEVPTTGANNSGFCVACLNSANGAAVDLGCTSDRPLCAILHDVEMVDTGNGDEHMSLVDVAGRCYTCQDTEVGSAASIDLGCSRARPYCVYGRDETGFGLGCSSYLNARCLFGTGDTIADDDTTCTGSLAVGARILVGMLGCRTNTLNLKKLATTISSVMNTTRCALQLSQIRSNRAKRHLLQEEGAGANLTFSLMLFVADEAQGNAIIANLESTIKVAMLLALIEDVGDVGDLNITAALVQVASATSDPHFVTTRGSKFDFNGEAGSSYCIVTDTQLQVNARFVGAAPDAALMSPTFRLDGKPDTRTWMDQVAILHGSDMVLVEAASPLGTPYTLSFGTVRVNGEPLLGRTAMVKLASGLIVARTKTRVMVTVPDVGAVEVEVVRAEFWQPGSGPGRNFLNLQLKQFTGLSQAHGILGQSLGGGDDSAQIEGASQDYKTSTIFAADCLYNQFGLMQN
eukprot:jgi/Mesvir1/29185/Mv25475-RA.3